MALVWCIRNNLTFTRKSKMAKSNEYEIRPRGTFMSDGNLIYADNPKMAAQKLNEEQRKMNRKETDCIVIRGDPGLDFAKWSLVSPDGHLLNSIAVMGKSSLHPYDLEPEERLAVAKACEAACQSREEKPSLEFDDFNKQAKKYEREHKIFIKTNLGSAKHQEKQAIELSATCIKECTFAEAAIANENPRLAEMAMRFANQKLKVAGNAASYSHQKYDTTTNAADKAVAAAEAQIKKTTKILEDAPKALRTNQHIYTESNPGINLVH